MEREHFDFPSLHVFESQDFSQNVFWIDTEFGGQFVACDENCFIVTATRHLSMKLKQPEMNIEQNGQ